MYKKEAVEKEISRLKNASTPLSAINGVLLSQGMEPAKGPLKMAELLRRPELKYTDILMMLGEAPAYDGEICEEVETEIKYEGYIEKQMRQIGQFKSLEKKALPADFDYAAVTGLRLEARQKLSAQKPENLGQASRISGVSPADVSVLMVYLAKNRRANP